MNYSLSHKNEEQQDRKKSMIITLIIALLVLLGLYYYTFTRTIPAEEKVTTMLINFGDQQNGNGQEEPANQEGSIAKNEITVPKPIAEPQPAPLTKEKIITGQNVKVSAPKSEKTEKKTNNSMQKIAIKKTSSTPKITSNSAVQSQGDGRGNAAIGNLIRGRGNNSGSQGNNGISGNAGDPLGGDGNGDSRIGINRKLVEFIPGTMGRGGAQPQHSCTASGKITISYVVDKAGNVVSAKRIGGISDPCAVTTTTAWVKKYVKAERANTSSTGTYKITF